MFGQSVRPTADGRPVGAAMVRQPGSRCQPCSTTTSRLLFNRQSRRAPA